MSSKMIFAAGAIFAVAAAVPMAKRDIVWVTQTDVDIVTVPVTTTVYVDSTATHYGHHVRPSKSTITSLVQSTVTVTSASAVSTSAAAVSTSEAPVSSADPTTSTSVYVAPTSTSVYVAPTTSTSVYVAPTTSTSVWVAPTTSTSVYVAPTTSAVIVPSTTSAAAAPTSTGSGSSTQYSGDITHYDVGLGSCGWTNTDDEAVVAIPHVLMNNPANPNNNPWCGKYITISYAGKSTQAKIVDTCGGCDGDSIDLSPTLFTTVAPTGDGRVHDVSWSFT